MPYASNLQEYVNTYKRLVDEASDNLPILQEIAKYVGIRLRPSIKNYPYSNPHTTETDGDEDIFVDDPTAAISVNQFGDFLAGVMWGNGEDVVRLRPSRYVRERMNDPQQNEGFYKFATAQLLFHMNHESAGFINALKPYSYDQGAFGTSGIGAFKNPHFESKQAENALVFRAFGVDSIVIAEGRNGLIETVYVTHWWTAQEVVNELAMAPDFTIDKKKLANLPQKVRKAHQANDIKQRFRVVFGVFPRSDFNPKLKGKRGTRFKGIWFMPDDQAGAEQPLREEDYKDMPIPVTRAIKLRGETYGRAFGTILLSAIKGVNYMVGSTFDVLDKIREPSMGVFSNAISGDNVLDTSAGGLTVFNANMAGQTGSPAFPLLDVGDPSGIINFLIPFLNDKISLGFKLDSLLDANPSDRELTATESLQRFSIRSKSMAGILLQQKVEMLIPIIKRSANLLFDLGELGVDRRTDPEVANTFEQRNLGSRVIPEEVIAAADAGQPWFELEFNGDLEKMTRSERVDSLLMILQGAQAAAGVDPKAALGFDGFKWMQEVKSFTDSQTQSILSQDDYDAKVEQATQGQAAQAGAEMANTQSQTDRNSAFAKKAEREAQEVE